MTREIVVRYNGYTIGGTNREAVPEDRYTFSRTRDGGTFEFSFVVFADDASTLGKLCEGIETNFRTPYKDLTIGFTTGGIYRGSQDETTYIDPIPQIEKLGLAPDSARARRYRVRIDFGLPADLNPTPGFRDVNADVQAAESGRRTLVVSGVTTALGDDPVFLDAREVYDQGIDAVVASIASRIELLEYELLEVDQSEETINVKTLQFQRTYQELIASQGGANLDDPRIIDQQLDVNRLYDAPGDSKSNPFGGGKTSVRRAATLGLSYSCSIEKDSKPQDVYQSIRGWLINKLRTTFGASNIALLSEDPVSNEDDNTLNVTMTALAPVGTGAPLTRSLNATQIDTKIDVIRYANDGTRFGASTYPRKGEVRRITVERTLWAKRVTTVEAVARAKGLASAQSSAGTIDGESGKWTSPDIRYDITPVTFGNGETIEGTNVTLTVVQVFVAKAKGGGGGPTTPRGNFAGGGATVTAATRS